MKYEWFLSQFHYGSIKTIYNKSDFLSLCTSQFHYGSIKTFSNKNSFNGMQTESQFHYGSIKTRIKDRKYDSQTVCLNSTMVRLKPAFFAVMHQYFEESQFHYGSIKTLIMRKM